MTPRLEAKNLELMPLGAAERATPAAANEPVPPSSAVQGRRWSDGLRSVSVDPNAPWSMSQHWPELVAALSEQAVDSSNLLLRALDFLVGAGRLRRNEAKALSDAMLQLRETSLRAQQITRLAGGRIRQAKERVELMEVIRNVMDERETAFVAAGAQVSAKLNPVDVLLDPPVAVSLLNAILDWGLSFSKELVLTLQTPEFPAPARLQVRVTTPSRQAPPPADAAPGSHAARQRGRRLNDGLYWMLLRQMAGSAGLDVVRTSADGAAVLTIEFPKTFLSSEGLACVELLDTEPRAAGTRESWVLLVTADVDLQRQAVSALRRTGIEAVAADNLEQARAMITENKPNVLITGYDIHEDELAAFRTEMLGETRCPVVEITRETPSFHINGFEGYETAKVGREQLDQELPATVLFELVKLA